MEFPGRKFPSETLKRRIATIVWIRYPKTESFTNFYVFCAFSIGLSVYSRENVLQQHPSSAGCKHIIVVHLPANGCRRR